MKEFKDLQHEPHVNWPGGTQSRMFFDNGYGVSVVRGGNGSSALTGSYGCDEGLWELGVVQGNDEKWGLTYETPITDDVLGRLTEAEVSDYMKQVQELPAA